MFPISLYSCTDRVDWEQPIWIVRSDKGLELMYVALTLLVFFRGPREPIAGLGGCVGGNDWYHNGPNVPTALRRRFWFGFFIPLAKAQDSIDTTGTLGRSNSTGQGVPAAFGLTGIYHYWKHYLFFQGTQANGGFGVERCVPFCLKDIL